MRYHNNLLFSADFMRRFSNHALIKMWSSSFFAPPPPPEEWVGARKSSRFIKTYHGGGAGRRGHAASETAQHTGESTLSAESAKREWWAGGHVHEVKGVGIDGAD